MLLTWRGSHYGSNTGSNALSYPLYGDFVTLLRKEMVEHPELNDGFTARKKGSAWYGPF